MRLRARLRRHPAMHVKFVAANARPRLLCLGRASATRSSLISWEACLSLLPGAIDIAKSRLRIASRSLDALRSSNDRPQEFTEHWFVFLTAWKGVYTVLEQGSKATAQSRQWFGGKKAERKADPLLQYLFEARNDEEHGLFVSVHHTQGGFAMRTTQEITTGVTFKFDMATGEAIGTAPDGKAVVELIQHTPPGPELRPVTARGGVIYEPPFEHLGKRIDIRPLPVAEVALAYAQALVAEAEEI